MSDADECVLLVFAKAPVLGAVKTRLCPPLSQQQALELYRRLLWRSLETAVSAGLGPVELCCAPDIGGPFFDTCRVHFGLQLKAQEPGDLGVKMRSALEAALTRADRAILIGTDCPAITASYLRTAARALTADNNIVLGPAEDGGYGLVGVTRMVADIFTDIPWGTALVMNATVGRLRANGGLWRELPPIWDVDRPEDLARLARDPQLKHLTKGIVPDRVAV